LVLGLALLIAGLGLGFGHQQQTTNSTSAMTRLFATHGSSAAFFACILLELALAITDLGLALLLAFGAAGFPPQSASLAFDMVILFLWCQLQKVYFPTEEKRLMYQNSHQVLRSWWTRGITHGNASLLVPWVRATYFALVLLVVSLLRYCHHKIAKERAS